MPRVRYIGPDPELKGTTALACEDVKWRIQLDRYPHQIGDPNPIHHPLCFGRHLFPPDHWTPIVDEHVRVLILWNLPWLAAKVIDRHSDGYPCHHCAIQLGDMVYESTFPRVRKLTVDEYEAEMAKWARNWRYRLGRPQFHGDEFDLNPSPEQYEAMLAYAERWLGTWYSLRIYYKDRPDRMNCSKYLAGILRKSGRDFGKPDYRVRPIDIWRKLDAGN